MVRDTIRLNLLYPVKLILYWGCVSLYAQGTFLVLGNMFSRGRENLREGECKGVGLGWLSMEWPAHQFFR